MFPRLLARLALIGVLSACADRVVSSPAPAAPTLRVAPPATVTPGARIDSVVVELRTIEGTPLVGVPITWRGDGAIVALDSATRSNGTARARWTLPRFPFSIEEYPGNGPGGRYVLTAIAAGAGEVTATVNTAVFTSGDVEAVSQFACGVKADGVWCWGDGAEFVFPGAERGEVPRRVLASSSVLQVSTTTTAVCVRDKAGAVSCATNPSRGAWQPITGMPPVTDLGGGLSRWCAVTAGEGEIWCWMLPATSATRLGEASGFVALEAGERSWCARRANGEVACWGRNGDGELGDGTRIDRETPAPIAGDHRFVHLSLGNGDACGATAEGEVWCWGVFAATGRVTEMPTRIATASAPIRQLHVGSAEVYLLTTAGLQTFWGGAPLPLDTIRHLDRFQVASVSGRSQLCLRTLTDEVHCSTILLYGGGDTSQFPSELTPVPLPSQP